MSRGTKIIILIAGGAAAIGLIGYLIIWPLFGQVRKATNANGNVNAPSGLPNANSSPSAGSPAAAVNVPPQAAVADEVKVIASAKTVAKTFAERLATYSNQNGLANLSDVAPLATAAVNKYLQGQYRADLIKSMPAGSDYFGVTATATNVNLAAASDAEMTGQVQLQLVESGSRQSVAYKVLDIKLKLSDGNWLVSWIEWGK